MTDVKVTFFYLNRTIEVFCKSNEEMDKMFGKFISKLGDDSELNQYIFYYEGNKLGHDTTIDKDRYLSGKKDINITAQRKLRMVKCPKCKCNDCIINLDNYLASYYGCKNNHSSISVYDQYINVQKIDSEEIRCNQSGCENTQKNYNKGFSKCLKCSALVKHSKYFCKDHISSHDKSHINVKYDKKNYYCEKNKHFKKFIKYCFTHHQNLCEECEKDHQGHNIADYESMTPDVKQLKDSIQKMEENINDLKIIIDDIKYSLDGALRIFKRYLYIAKDIIGKYEFFNKDLKNNRILKSLWNLQHSNDKMNNVLTKIINEENRVKKADLLINMYEKKEENLNNNINETIDYKKEDDEWWKEIEKKGGGKKNEGEKNNDNNNINNKRNLNKSRKIKNH